MTTYNSYEEAKIANPESEIVTTGPNWEYNPALKWKFEKLVEDDGEVDAHALEDSAWVKCNPADHCMTVEKFLKAGHKGINGDSYLDDGGTLMTLGVDISSRAFNEKGSLDHKMHILRAAALEGTNNLGSRGNIVNEVELDCVQFSHPDIGSFVSTGATDEKVRVAIESLNPSMFIRKPDEKPNRVKVGYVKHNVNDEGGKYWEVARDWAEGNVQFRFKRNDDFYCLIGSNEDLLRFYTNRTLYTLQETEITERDEFIEVFQILQEDYILDDNYDTEQFGEFLFDSGKFKLVD